MAFAFGTTVNGHGTAGRLVRFAGLALIVPVLAGCAGFGLSRDMTGVGRSQLEQRLGPPAAVHALPDGRLRLEYSTTPMGRENWMADLDAQGIVTRWVQVLTPAGFAAIVPGQTMAEVRRALGRPAEQARLPHGRQLWSWRWPTYDCLWMQVEFGADGRVNGQASAGPDPLCDVDID